MAIINATSNGTYFLGNNDQININIAGGGSVTVKAKPGPAVKKIRIEYRNDTVADTATVDLSTFNQNGLQIDVKKYDPTDRIILQGATNGFIDPSDPTRYNFTYVGSDGKTYTGYINAKDGNAKDLFAKPIIIVCFGDGTLIETERGLVAVEELSVGDRVMTLTNGPQPIRWIGRRTVDIVSLKLQPELRPIVVRKDALGPGKPFRDLTLSPNHRILLQDWRAELHFGAPEVLVAVKFLVDDRSIRAGRADRAVTYHHFLFDRHEIVRSNGLETESLFFGQAAQDTIDEEARAELLALFPELELTPEAYGPTSHPVLRGYEAALFLPIRS